MFPGIPRIPILLLTLFAFLLTGPGGVSAYVLCIGADGHAAIERDHDGGCGREASCPAPAQTSPHCDGAAEHGAPCTDIPPSLSTATPRSKPALAAPAAALVFVAPSAPHLPSAAFLARTPRFLDQTNTRSALQLLRIIVQRC